MNPQHVAAMTRRTLSEHRPKDRPGIVMPDGVIFRAECTCGAIVMGAQEAHVGDELSYGDAWIAHRAEMLVAALYGIDPSAVHATREG